MKRNQKKKSKSGKKESKSKKEKPAKKQKLEESSEPDQQEDNSEPDLVSGSLVWAKIGGFPFWPAMVCPDWRSGPLQSYHRKVASYHQYHVRFFGDASEAWINRSGLKKHPEEQPQTVGTVSKTKKKKILKMHKMISCYQFQFQLNKDIQFYFLNRIPRDTMTHKKTKNQI